jgi:hypothetical protein
MCRAPAVEGAAQPWSKRYHGASRPGGAVSEALWPGRLRFVTADREFIGQQWIGWLLDKKVPFRIRIKAGEYLLHADGTEKRGFQWFASQSCACKPRPMELWGLPVYVGGKYLHGTEYLIVISNEKGDLLEEYRLRWKVETLFQH